MAVMYWYSCLEINLTVSIKSQIVASTTMLLLSSQRCDLKVNKISAFSHFIRVASDVSSELRTQAHDVMEVFVAYPDRGLVCSY